MRVNLICIKCVFENIQHKAISAEYSNTGRYALHCENGHRNTIILQESKYEILFEIATNAIVDGYYREAISSFSSCLERFNEYAIGILIEESGVDRALFKSEWKNVSNQSERQLGAFIFLWVSKFKTSPLILDKKIVEFRNSVIHKGKIPTKDEAKTFGDEVLKIIIPQLLKLRNTLTTAFNKNYSYEMQEHVSSAKDEQDIVVSTTIPTIFRLALSEEDFNYSLDSHIERITNQRNIPSL